MFTKVKENLELLFSILCGVFLILGIIFNTQNEGGLPFFISSLIFGGFFAIKEGFEELFFEKHLSVDVLMILAALGACFIGDWFEGAMLMLIFSLAEALEERATARSQKAIEELLTLTPPIARVIRQNEIIEIATSELQIGDIVQVRKGENIPIDGTLQSEYAQINEAAITGEALPVEKQPGDNVIGGTLNLSDTINIVVTTTNDNTLFSKIVKLVEQAQSTPSKTASFIERIEDTYVKIVLISVPLFIALMYFVMKLPFDQAFYRGMVLLTVASPCALVASATPATLSAISRASKNHMLFKGGQALDKTSQITRFIFDKTGTLTTGQFSVVAEHYTDVVSSDVTRTIVKSAEITSTHPIATALVSHFSQIEPKSFKIAEIVGLGLEVIDNEDIWRIGKAPYVLKNNKLTDEQQQYVSSLESSGTSIIYVSKNYHLAAIYGIADTLKESTASVISRLKALHIKPMMLTGDQLTSAKHIAKLANIDDVVANCLPDDKVKTIVSEQDKKEVVAMVGDGINDAPALAIANVSFAMGGGSDMAMENADVILIKNDLEQLPFAIALSKKLKTIVTQNIIFSLGVIIILILSNLLQWINLPFGVVAHEGSTILVILNSLRLLNFKDK